MKQEELSIKIKEQEEGMRIDKLLASYLTDISRVTIQKSIKNGNAKVNEIIITEAKHILKNSDIVQITLSDNQEINTLTPYELELNIIHEDEDILVIDKPAGLSVHPGAGNKDKTLANALFAHYGNQLSDIGDSLRPGIVHRLDKETSGLMVIAKNNKAHLHLSKQIEKREVERRYLALIYGTLFPTLGTIKTNLGRSKKDRTKMTVMYSGGKQAITHYKIQKTFGDAAISLIECKLETGRTHQIRVHLSFKAHPIVGDKTYLNSRIFNLNSLNEEAKNSIKSLKRQALHAFSLKFLHPRNDKEMLFESSLPYDLKNLLNALENSVFPSLS